MSTATSTATAATRRVQVRVSARTRVFLVLILLAITLLVPSEGYIGAARADLVVNRAVGDQGFRLIAWEAQAITQKLSDAFAQPGDDLSPAQRHDLVITYFDTLRETRRLALEIERVFANPEDQNPAVTAAPLQARLDGLRGEQERRRPAVERILQQQVAEVLRSEGFTTAGLLWPPVLFQFTESPDYLIISPRDRIVLHRGVYLEPGQPVSRMEHMESQVAEALDVSALVEGTGGFSAYPTMVIAHPDLAWVLSTIIHEWAHTYLVFYPLGWNYFESRETRTLNETTASIIGDELSERVLERFYPEKVPPPPAAGSSGGGSGSAATPSFSFGATMRETRLRVDELLAEGRVEEAEAYMEAQRQVFVEHGYALRKLNQAYFAFHGSYAVGPAATDPIGDKLRALRAQSPTLLAFVETVRGLTSEAELDAALAQARTETRLEVLAPVQQ